MVKFYKHECVPIEGEPSFTLLARDPMFAVLIDLWVARREADMRCGLLPASDMAQVQDAKDVSARGAEWRRLNNGAWRHRTPDVEVSAIGDVTTVKVTVPGNGHSGP